MATRATANGVGGDLPFAKTLFEAADRLRGSVESDEYKHLWGVKTRVGVAGNSDLQAERDFWHPTGQRLRLAHLAHRADQHERTQRSNAHSHHRARLRATNATTQHTTRNNKRAKAWKREVNNLAAGSKHRTRLAVYHDLTPARGLSQRDQVFRKTRRACPAFG
jgi:hypothetical protein